MRGKHKKSLMSCEKNLADGGGGTSRKQNITETPIAARTPHATTWQH